MESNRFVSPREQVAALRQEFAEEQSRQGVVSRIGAKGVDLFKRTVLKPFGNQSNSKSIEKQLDQLEQTAQRLEQSGQSSPNNPFIKEFQAKVEKTDTNLDKFHKSNEIGGTVAKTAAITGAVAVGTALAPVTGGASLAVGIGVGVAASEATGYVDKNTSEGKVTLNPFDGGNRFTKKDAAVAGVTGATTGLMGPVGKAAGTAVTSRLAGHLSQAEVTIVKNQVAGAIAGGGTEFVGTTAKTAADQGQLNGHAVLAGVKTAPAGALGGLLGGTAAGVTKLRLGSSEATRTLGRIENAAVRKVAVTTLNTPSSNPLRRP